VIFRKAPQEPPDASPVQAPTHARPRTAGRHHDAKLPTRSPSQCLHVTGDPTNARRPPASPGTASPHPCWCPGSRRASTPHPRTLHAGTARTQMSRHAPSTTPETSLFAYGSRARPTPATRSRPVHIRRLSRRHHGDRMSGCGAPCGALFFVLSHFTAADSRSHFGPSRRRQT